MNSVGNNDTDTHTHRETQQANFFYLCAKSIYSGSITQFPVFTATYGKFSNAYLWCLHNWNKAKLLPNCAVGKPVTRQKWQQIVDNNVQHRSLSWTSSFFQMNFLWCFYLSLYFLIIEEVFAFFSLVPMVLLSIVFFFLLFKISGLCRGEVPRRSCTFGPQLHGSLPVHKIGA